jgi:hypothetical protein
VTADQREQALAAMERLVRILRREGWDADDDAALIRAAFTRPLPADLAAAFDRVSDPEYGERLEWNSGGARTYTAVEREADLALVRAALTPPPLPADLAEIQARIDAEAEADPEYGDRDDPSGAHLNAAMGMVGRLVAELAELRARPTLAAEEAEWLLGKFDVDKHAHIPMVQTLTAIADQGNGTVPDDAYWDAKP